MSSRRRTNLLVPLIYPESTCCSTKSAFLTGPRSPKLPTSIQEVCHTWRTNPSMPRYISPTSQKPFGMGGPKDLLTSFAFPRLPKTSAFCHFWITGFVSAQYLGGIAKSVISQIHPPATRWSRVRCTGVSRH